MQIDTTTTADATTAITAKYELPADTYKDWQRCEHADFVPNARQQLVADAVQKALDSGLYYSKDVVAFCKRELHVTEEQEGVGAKRVENGEVGMDCYYARKYLDKQRELSKARNVLKLLQPKAGQLLGTLMFSDYKRNTGAVITQVSEDGMSITVQGKRGAAVATFTCSPLQVANAMDRAAERGLRKAGFEGTYGSQVYEVVEKEAA